RRRFLRLGTGSVTIAIQGAIAGPRLAQLVAALRRSVRPYGPPGEARKEGCNGRLEAYPGLLELRSHPSAHGRERPAPGHRADLSEPVCRGSLPANDARPRVRGVRAGPYLLHRLARPGRPPVRRHP